MPNPLGTLVAASGFAAKAIPRCNGSESTKAMDFTIAILRETDRLTSMIGSLLDLVKKDVQDREASQSLESTRPAETVFS